uniref:Uncharacterized protein n=1 Tax=Aegilops tauschii subsp. strangulata TaxID=200361 RepID=A0A453KP74_AEGTS
CRRDALPTFILLLAPLVSLPGPRAHLARPPLTRPGLGFRRPIRAELDGAAADRRSGGEMTGKKRKAEAARLDETDRAMYGAFRGAANSLSQLYTLAMGGQKLSFQAGERHAMEKLYEWILRQHENGLRLTVGDIASHVQSMRFSMEATIRWPLQDHNMQAKALMVPCICPTQATSNHLQAYLH